MNYLDTKGYFAFDVHHPPSHWKIQYLILLTRAGFITDKIKFEEQNIPAKDGVRKVGFVFAEK